MTRENPGHPKECDTIKPGLSAKQAMEALNLSTEVILTHPHRSLGNIQLDWVPQPGSFVELEGKTYTVLERRHRYQLRAGRYRLHQISLYVQSAQPPSERTLMNGRWVLGDATCRFNAHSELIRCAVSPEGPCGNCRFYEQKPATVD
jgi:Family of unknown function (DUF6464)